MISEVLTPERARQLDGPGWLAAVRLAAAERLADLSLPTTDLEEWRYSRIDDVDAGSWTIPEPGDHGSATALGQSILDRLGELSGSVLLVNGSVVSARLSEAATAAGVRFGEVSDADAMPDILVDSVKGTETLDALNSAFTVAPLELSVPRGVVVNAPFAVVSVAADASGDGRVDLVPTRLVVRAGENSEFVLLDWSTGLPTARADVLPYVDIVIERTARVEVIGVNDLNSASDQFGSLRVRVDQEASFRLTYASLGGLYARSRFECRLVGRGASGDLTALYFGSGDQMHDFRTFQTHEAPDTSSNLVFKGAVDDRAHSVYTGMIRVGENARGTNASQTNRNIKLSDEAWAESVPNLEINNNDVKCSHASAVGPIDEDQRFYLESRGVPPEVAERLVVSGFFEEVLEGIGHEPAAAMIRSLVQAAVGATDAGATR